MKKELAVAAIAGWALLIPLKGSAADTTPAAKPAAAPAASASTPAATGATPEAKGEHPRRQLMDADTNHDGKVTFEELKAQRPKLTKERFDQLDTNHDGVITKDDKPTPEQMQKRRQEYAEKLKAADKNNDGKVTYEEAKSQFPKLTQEGFNRMDTNHDGAITKDDRHEGGAGAGGDKASSEKK